MTFTRVTGRVLTLVVAIPLVVFNLRRILFAVVAAMTPAPAEQTPTQVPASEALNLPRLLVLVPCRNDGAVLPSLIHSLVANGYPRDCLRVLIIDDASTDGSAAEAARLSTEHSPVVRSLRLPQSLGKAAALNAALSHEPWGEIIAVYDADHLVTPGALADLVVPFTDDNVGGISACTEISNALDSPSAYYAAIERLVHQRLTMVAKDRLGLAPALLGSHCAYRRALLEELGGFAPGVFLEDSDLTVRLAAAGWRTHFLEARPAIDQAPASVAGYWRQHVRWGRGFQDVAASQAGSLLRNRLSWRLRFELFLFSLGYLDRLALLVAAVFVMADRLFGAPFRFPVRLLAFTLLLPYVQVVIALVRTHKPASWWLRLPLLIVYFPIDVAAALRSTTETLLNRPRAWTPTVRQSHPGTAPLLTS